MEANIGGVIEGAKVAPFIERLRQDQSLTEATLAIESLRPQIRAFLLRKLALIESALQEMMQGTRRKCTRCLSPLTAERLEWDPSVTHCEPCSSTIAAEKRLQMLREGDERRRLSWRRGRSQ